MGKKEERKNSKEAEIQSIMVMMAVPYCSAVELYNEFNRIDGSKVVPVTM